MQLGITRNQPNYSFPNLASQMVSQATGAVPARQSLAQQISGLNGIGRSPMPQYTPTFGRSLSSADGFRLPTGNMNFGSLEALTGGANSDALSSLVQGMGTGGDKPQGLWGKVDGWVGDNFNNWGDALKTGFAGVETIGKLWSAFQMNKMAKQQFNFSKDMANTNLANQITAFNTVLSDRARSRAVVEGQTDAERDAYIENNKARDTRENKG